MACDWESYEDFDRDYIRVLDKLGPARTRQKIAENLGISRFTLNRLHKRFWSLKSFSCAFCGESLPAWATKRKRFCSDACRAKHWRLARP
jgi:hypothetical protein